MKKLKKLLKVSMRYKKNELVVATFFSADNT